MLYNIEDVQRWWHEDESENDVNEPITAFEGLIYIIITKG